MDKILDIGQELFDMHYGLSGLVKKFEVVSERKFIFQNDEAARAFDTFITLSAGKRYVNKLLVVIDYPNSFGDWTAAYSYDGRMGGIITLSEKGE